MDKTREIVLGSRCTNRMQHLITATLYILLTFVFVTDLQAANEYTITATVGSGGSISPSGAVLANSGDSRTFTITPNTGYHVADVTVDGISQGAITSYTFSNVTANHIIQASFSSTIVFAVNSGGPQYTDSTGVTYLADTNYSGGYPGSTPATISGTTDGALYQSERYSNFSYTIPVANGNYSVSLKFAEIYFSSVGQRVFSVVINGQTVISNLDLYAKVGKNTAYDVVIPVSVTNGVVNINFISQVEKAKVSAIKIAASPASSYAITESAGTGGIISPADTVTVNPGGSQTFTISPNTGYHIVDVRVDGVSQGAVNSYTFTNVTANHTIQAIFYSSSNGNVVAINSGGPQYTDSTGVTYLADTISSGGYPGYTTATISGTTDGTLYKSERYSNSSYTIPVANGNYSVTLKFAEFYLSSVGQRVFSVAINGQTVISNLDVFAKVGKNVAYDVVIPVSVTNGVVNINFISQVENAKVSAIKIAASAASSYTITESAGTGGIISPADTVTVNPGGSQTFTITPNLGYHVVDVRVDGVSQGAVNSYTFSNVTANHTIQAIFYSSSNGNVFAVNSGGPQYTDSTGITYLADTNYSGGKVGITTATISGTVDDTIYQTERNGSFSYNIPAANGNYSVTLKFAEIYWTAPGQRVFSVAINGQTVISNLDLCAVAGANTAYEVVIPVSVTSGAININFISLVNNPKVSAIKIAASAVIVPNVSGMTQQDGQAALVAAQLAVGTITTTYSNTISQGKIITQNPQAGTMTTPGALINLVVSLGPAPQVLPPDPATVASTLDPTVSTTVAAASKFLYTGANPIQTGVVSGTIDVIRAAVLRGLVTDRDGTPLSGVTVSILSHPEFGQTLSRTDGMFDMAVNGGGLLTVTYEKDGYLPAHRQVNAPWQDYAWLPAVALIPVDAQVTTINLTSASQFQVHRESVVTDSDGTRQATLLFSPGTSAQMVMPDGSTQPVNSLSIRATEYTVGPNGPKAMPGQLPPASGYTYAVELSADEAIVAGAKQVTFTQPVYVYVDNFIGFPVGETVPAGYYDRELGQWIASQNGRVIKILSITAGHADIDTDGSGLVSDSTKLATLGITPAEQQQLAALYPQTPKSLWRVPVTHFSPWDFNWAYGPPPDAVPPNQPEPVSELTQDPCEKGGSIIECQNQVLGERIGITGTLFTLNYRSSRVPGFSPDHTMKIPLSGATVPADLKRIDLIIKVAGRQFLHSFPAVPNQSYTFTWDGKDIYGRTVQGKQNVKVNIGYVYSLVYLTARPGPGYEAMFGHFTYYGTPITANSTDREVTLWQIEQLSFSGFSFNYHSQGLGAWDLDIHHLYDPVGKVLLLGDGSFRSADAPGASIITTVAGRNSFIGSSGDGGPATSAQIYNSTGVAVGPDGSFYIIDFYNQSLRRVGPDGIITTVAGNGGAGYGGDGGPATSASFNYMHGVAVGPDGSIYIADTLNHRIRRVGPDGIITTVAGNGGNGYSGDGGPATSAMLNFPGSIALGSDGSIYIADTSNQRIRQVGPDGIITTVAGNGNNGIYYDGDGGPATSASLSNPTSVAVGPDGSIYIAVSIKNRIRRVGPNGIITTVAGNGIQDYDGDDGPAVSASLYYPNGLAVALDGSIYIADTLNHRIRRVGPDGIITTVAGNGGNGYSGDGGPPTSALFSVPESVAVGPDGGIYIAELSGRIRRIAHAWPGASVNDFYFPSEDGSQLYVFNGSGKHQRTLNALTGAILFNFSYDSGGRLVMITDGANNITTIERDSSGNPTAIVAPFGQRTALTLDTNGYLASITYPAGEATRMSYTDSGLMTTFTDPKGNIHNFTYDGNGLLVRDENPAGGYTALSGTNTLSTKQEVLSTALGRISTYFTEYLSNGDQRQTFTMPSGAQSVTLSKTDGSKQIIMPDGTTISTTLGIDPRFATLVHIPASTTVKTPSGLTRTTTLTRTAMLSNPNNLLSLTSQTDTLNINNQVYTTTYNASSMTYTLTTPAGRSSSRAIDTLGRPVSLLPAAGITPVNYNYDAQGFLSTVSQGPLMTTYGYDTLKRLNSVTIANHPPLGLAYDDADRVKKLTLPSGHSYLFGYDANGNRTRITMPSGAVHKLGYTTINLGSDYTPPSSLPYVWHYSPDQEWTSTILPSGRTIDAGYETSGGRSLGFVYPEASVSLNYGDLTDRVSRVIRTPTINGATQQIGFTYDGSLVTGWTYSGAVNGQFTYTYDNNFFLKQINLTSGTDAVSTPITRDADGIVTGYGPFTFTRGGPAGAVSQINDTALNMAITYDNLGRVGTRSHTVNGQTIYSIQFTYESRGNISRKIETFSGETNTWDYTYDADGQLTAVKENGVDEELYTYDVNGNRTGYEQPGAWSVLADYDAQDRLVQLGGTTYQFNADGQLTQRGTDTFQYSAQGELLQATVEGQSITYTYDGTGRRVARTDSTGTTQYLYGNQSNPFQLTAMRDPAGVLSNFYYDNAGSLFAFDKGGVRYYVAADRVGTPKVVTDATGAVVKFLEFDSFGMPTFDSNPEFNLPVGFAGGLTDDKTGLVRFGYRDYEPGTGRWTAKDPIFFSGGQGNLYVYVQNNPINFIDPFGLCKKRSPVRDMAKGFTFGIMASGVVVWEAGKMAVIDATKASLSELLEVPLILDKAYTGYEAYQNVTHEYRDIGERVGDRIQRLKDWWYDDDKECSEQCK